MAAASQRILQVLKLPPDQVEIHVREGEIEQKPETAAFSAKVSKFRIAHVSCGATSAVLWRLLVPA